jgi:quercetin dioxygenase-like cupin family protein
MMRRAGVLGATLLIGIAAGAMGTIALSAQQRPGATFTELLRTDLAGLEGKEAIVGIAEIAPGTEPGRHYHPGHEFFYLLEGSFTYEEDGRPPVVLKAGDVGHHPARRVAEATNVMQPVKMVIFFTHEKGQPLRVAVE